MLHIARAVEGGNPVSHTGAGDCDRLKLRKAIRDGKGIAARTMKAIEDCIGKDAKASPYVLLNLTNLSKANAPVVVARAQAALLETAEKNAKLQVRGLRCAAT